MESRNWNMFHRAIATVAVCVMGTLCMYWTEGKTGIGWAILGILLIWDGARF